MIKRFSPTAIGRWSTRRPVLAIAGWLTFVVAAVLALSLTGSKPLENGAVGESARGYALMDSHQLGLPPREYAYLHSVTLDSRRAAISRRDHQVSARMGDRARQPARVAISRDQHAALVTVDAHEAAGHREPRGGGGRESGAATRASPRCVADATSGTRQRPAPRRAAVDSGHAGRAADLVRRARRGARAGAARGHGGDRRVRAARSDQPGVPARRQRQDRRAADRDGGRGRLRAVLCRPLARGAAPRRVDPRGARAHVPHLGALGADRRDDRGDRDGRPVRGRLGHLQRDRGRHDRRGGVRGRRIGHGPAGAAPAARDHASTADGSRSCRSWRPPANRASGPAWSTACSAARCWPPACRAGCWSRSRCRRSGCTSPSRARTRSPRRASPSWRRRSRGEFPSTSSPAIVVATWPAAATRGHSAQAVERLENLAATRGIAHPPFAVGLGPDGRSLALGLPLTGFGDNTASRTAVRELRNVLVPETLGRVPGVADRGHRRHRRGHRLHQPDAPRGSVRGRVRARARVRPAAGRVPLDRGADQGDRAQPAVGRRVLRRARARVPAPLGAGRARLPLGRRDHLVAAAVPVRGPVRAVDGLPRVHPEPRQGGRRRRDAYRGRAAPRDLAGPPAWSAPRRS